MLFSFPNLYLPRCFFSFFVTHLDGTRSSEPSYFDILVFGQGRGAPTTCYDRTYTRRRRNERSSLATRPITRVKSRGSPSSKSQSFHRDAFNLWTSIGTNSFAHANLFRFYKGGQLKLNSVEIQRHHHSETTSSSFSSILLGYPDTIVIGIGVAFLIKFLTVSI